jgi:tetratricopeptide (TPR) repeat protein
MYLTADLKRSISILIQRNTHLIIVTALAFFTSLNTITNDFAYDDWWMFVKNPFMQSGRNLALVFFTNPWTPVDGPGLTFYYFRPLIATFHIVEYHFFGTKAGAYHLINVIIHALVTGLVFIILRKISDRPRLAFIAAALFAVHPVHAESVAWISGVPDILVALFGLIIVYVYLLYRQAGQWYHVILMSGLFLGALLTKETALMLSATILLVEIYLGKSIGIRNLHFRRVFAVWGAFAVSIFVYLLLRFYSNGGVLFNTEQRYPLINVLATIPNVILKYLELLVVPSGYSIYHFINPAADISFSTFWGPLLLIAIVVSLIVRFGSGLLVFSVAWFGLWLLPALMILGTFVPAFHFAQERYLYLPSIGFCLSAALGFDWLYKKFGKSLWANRAMQVSFIFLIAALASVHARQNRVWHDTLSLIEHNAQVNSRLPEAHVALASEYLTEQRFPEAVEAASIARQLGPNNLDAYRVSSMVAAGTNDLDNAVKYLEYGETIADKEYNSVWDVANVNLRLGQFYVKKNDLIKAEYNFRKAADVGSNIHAWDELGQFYYNQGRFAESLNCFKQAELHAPPRSGYMHIKLGRVYEKLNQLSQARQEYEMYIRLVPEGRYRKHAEERLEIIRAAGE